MIGMYIRCTIGKFHRKLNHLILRFKLICKLARILKISKIRLLIYSSKISSNQFNKSQKVFKKLYQQSIKDLTNNQDLIKLIAALHFLSGRKFFQYMIDYETQSYMLKLRINYYYLQIIVSL